MAGSDGLRRTNRRQNYPAEKAPEGKGSDGKFSQIAIVYGGGNITLYKNGEVLDSYNARNVDLLSRDDLLLVFGIRHVGLAGLGRFHGKIDDARVYKQALTAEQIKSLKPNEKTAGTPEPFAWFDFNGEKVVDRAGNFKATKLTQTARLEEGNLVLDDGDVLVAAANEEIIKENFRLSGQPFDIADIDQYDWPTMPKNPPANWTTYHLAHPGPGDARPGDPNCAFYWKGLYHLFYIYRRPEGYSFAHVASKDMVHWQWYPTTLTPKFTSHGMFSGTALFTKEGEPFIVYNGQGSGRNQISFPADDLAVAWGKPFPINVIDPKTGDRVNIVFADPDCWLVDDTYYAMNGVIDPVVYKSKDLKKWELIGSLVKFKDDPNRKEPLDISCANLFPIGDNGKWMLHFISHNTGCRYYLGEWKDEQFVVEEEHYMSWRRRSLFAQESLLTPDGRRVMWAWCFAARGGFGFRTGVQSLPRELSLPDDNILRIKPLKELESLRYDEKKLTNLEVKAGQSLTLDGIRGDTLELEIKIAANKATRFGVKVFCDKENRGPALFVDRAGKKLVTTYERAPFELKDDEEITLRVFLDKAMIELFANDRQAMVDAAKHSPENVGIALFSEGDDLKVTSVKAWKMRPAMTAENSKADLSALEKSAQAVGAAALAAKPLRKSDIEAARRLRRRLLSDPYAYPTDAVPNPLDAQIFSCLTWEQARRGVPEIRIISKKEDKIEFIGDKSQLVNTDRHRLESPSRIIFHEGKYHCWIMHLGASAKRGRGQRNIYITSTDGTRWTVEGVFPNGEKGSLDSGWREGIQVVKFDGKFWMFYAARSKNLKYYGKRRDTRNCHGICLLVASRPEGPWKRAVEGPLFSRSDDPKAWDYDVVNNPYPVYFRGKWFIYYKTRNAALLAALRGSMKTLTGVAVADSITGPYVKYEGNPICDAHGSFAWVYRGGITMLPFEYPTTGHVHWSPDGVHFQNVDDPKSRGITMPTFGSLYLPHDPLCGDPVTDKEPDELWGLEPKITPGQKVPEATWPLVRGTLTFNPVRTKAAE